MNSTWAKGGGAKLLFFKDATDPKTGRGSDQNVKSQKVVKAKDYSSDSSDEREYFQIMEEENKRPKRSFMQMSKKFSNDLSEEENDETPVRNIPQQHYISFNS